MTAFLWSQDDKEDFCAGKFNLNSYKSGWRGRFWDGQVCKISEDDVGSDWEARHQVKFDDDNIFFHHRR